MGKSIDMSGQKINYLKIIKQVSYRNASGNIQYECLCECGNITYGSGADIRSGKKKSCGCFKIKRITKPPGAAGLNMLYHSYKFSARKNNRYFLLTIEQFKSITSSNCHYCCSEPRQLKISEKDVKKYNGNYIYNGIDRIDNNKGYDVRNSVPCCKICNTMKMTLSLEQFRDHVIKIAERFNNREIGKS